MISVYHPNWMEVQVGSVWRNNTDDIFKKRGPEGTLVVVIAIGVRNSDILIQITPFGEDRKYSEVKVDTSVDYFLKHYLPTGRRGWVNGEETSKF